ncbi:unnamed protein product [Litomosoides sigmodontis]|uniref:Uncharacterized protein n=1 Tax=Litomosoides sigmodontis TaxID=42156 RepID=A0A3P6TY93_LITSI|nr:unnamed protein product [Litomosoides sigmodontis]
MPNLAPPRTMYFPGAAKASLVTQCKRHRWAGRVFHSWSMRIFNTISFFKLCEFVMSGRFQATRGGQSIRSAVVLVDNALLSIFLLG